MAAKRNRSPKDPNDMTRVELIEAVIQLRRMMAINISNIRKYTHVSAVDRNGKEYTRDEMIGIFERLYYENTKAIRLMFPSFSINCIHGRARLYGMNTKLRLFGEKDDNIIRKYHPDYKKIAGELGRTIVSVKTRANMIGLRGTSTREFLWNADEDDLLRCDLPVPGRNARSKEKRRKALGINANFIRKARSIPAAELRKLVEAHVGNGYPEQYRLEAVSDVVEMCYQGRCGTKPEQLIAAGKKAISAVYKLHPDRGAPISMDAKLFDDGDSTVGDRISSDAFHF